MMPLNLLPGMKHALDLTRNGDLGEATRMIQKLLSPSAPSSDAQRASSPSERIIDIEPVQRLRPAIGEFQETSGKRRKPLSNQSTRRAFRGSAGALSYDLYLPAAVATGMPLLVMLHGCTQSADDFARGTRMNALAEEFGFCVAYPEQAQGANMQKCWNWFRPGDQVRDRGEPSLIAGMIRDIAREHDIDLERVYIAGLSAGGAAAANLAAAYPDIFAAVGIHSGLACGSAKDMPSAFAAMNGGGMVKPVGKQLYVPTITFHGGKDHTVNPINSRQIHEKFAGHQALAETTTVTEQGKSKAGKRFVREALIAADGRSLAESWVVPDAGHSWSGGSRAGSYTDSAGPDASREMVRFFLQHRLRAKT